jgi:hypothetical protein
MEEHGTSKMGWVFNQVDVPPTVWGEFRHIVLTKEGKNQTEVYSKYPLCKPKYMHTERQGMF